MDREEDGDPPNGKNPRNNAISSENVTGIGVATAVGPETIEGPEVTTSSTSPQKLCASTTAILDPPGASKAKSSPISASSDSTYRSSSTSVDTMSAAVQPLTITLSQKYDVLDASRRWCEGEVVKIDHAHERVLVSYVYWDSKFDEWIKNISERFAVLHTHTYSPERGILKTGQRLEVLDEYKKWLEAFVVDENEAQIKIHYKGYHEKFDEWISRAQQDVQERIRPYGRHKVIAPKPHRRSIPVLREVPVKQWRVPGLNRRHHHHQQHQHQHQQYRYGAGTTSSSQRRQVNSGYNDQENQPYNAKLSANAGADDDEYSPHGSIGTENERYLAELERVDPTAAAVARKELLMMAERQVNRRSSNDNNHMVDEEEEEEEDRTRRIAQVSIQYVQYIQALRQHDPVLEVVPVQGDGNCLFRAVAHQVYGDENLHLLVREKCVDYMECAGDFFCQFVEGGKDMFPYYLQAKRTDGCWGDDPEIEAICKLYNRPAEIWAYDAVYGARKLRTFHEATGADSITATTSNTHGRNILSALSSVSASASSSSSSLSPRGRGGGGGGGVFGTLEPMRLSYYGGGHYDSVITSYHHTAVVTRSPPGQIEDQNIALAKDHSWALLNPQLNAALLNSVADAQLQQLQQSDREATEQAALAAALEQSKAQQQLHLESSYYDDLETCLLMSLQQSQDPAVHHRQPPLSLSSTSSTAVDSATGGGGGGASGGGGTGTATASVEYGGPSALKEDDTHELVDNADAAAAKGEQGSSTVTGANAATGGAAGIEGDVESSSGILQQQAQDHAGTRAMMTVDPDLIAVQGDIMRTMREESEREYLEKAIADSLCHSGSSSNFNHSHNGGAEAPVAGPGNNTGNITGNVSAALEEEALLERAKRESEAEQLDRETAQIVLQQSMQQSMQQQQQQPLQQQYTMSEDEALEVALRQSIAESTRAGTITGTSTTHHGGTAPTANTGSQFQSEDEMLQLALAASMQNSYSGSTTRSIRNNDNDSNNNSNSRSGYSAGGGYMDMYGNIIPDQDASSRAEANHPQETNNSGSSMGGGTASGQNSLYMEEMDEELMRAIQESLRK